MSALVVDDDIPIPLAQAADLFLPAGGVSVSTLRTEARKGRLNLERIAGRDFVTRRAIQNMRELCRIQQRDQGSISASAAAVLPSGSSETERKKQALASARASASKLTERSATMCSPASGQTPAKVIRGEFS